MANLTALEMKSLGIHEEIEGASSGRIKESYGAFDMWKKNMSQGSMLKGLNVSKIVLFIELSNVELIIS